MRSVPDTSRRTQDGTLASPPAPRRPAPALLRLLGALLGALTLGLVLGRAPSASRPLAHPALADATPQMICLGGALPC